MPIKLIYKALDESLDVKRDFVEAYKDKLILAADAMGQAIREGGKVLVCGNGGSASDALHFVGEMIGRLNVERRPLPAIALNADVASLTAVGNDYGFEDIFARQVKALARPEDVLLAISTSGNSENVIRAVQEARIIGVYVIGLLGRGGGKLLNLCHTALVANGSCSSRVQETHIFAIHTMVDLLDTFFLDLTSNRLEFPSCQN